MTVKCPACGGEGEVNEEFGKVIKAALKLFYKKVDLDVNDDKKEPEKK